MTPRRNDAENAPVTAVWDRLLILLAAMGAALAILAAVVAIRGGAPAEAAETDQQTGQLSLSEFVIDGDLEFDPGPVLLEVANAGSQVHNLTMEGGPATPDLSGGDSATLDLGDLSAGTYVVFCSIAGHREAGMEASLVVNEGVTTDHTVADEGTEADWAELDRLMTESILAFPAETEGKGNQLLEPQILADGTKEFHLTAAITEWEVAPGKMVDAWSYNGMVPAPMIRADVGDRIRVVLDNQLPMGTDIHWHGVKVPNSMDGVAPLTQPLVESGDTFVYEFTATEPAIAMYHAHHHGQMQVPNGLFGTVIIGDTPVPRGQTISGVEIPEDLEITQEIPMVLNDAGVIGLSLNGKSFPATEPYVGKVGDWVVAHYFNEGLQIHPMHQHQFPQLVFAKDGIPLDQPYWADTVAVAPGERYSVLFLLEDPGVWVWHCHILNHVESDTGMFGMVTAWIVEE
jgi:FtsP/CotA-like multicopper oxidase with cupredoxin domain